MIRTTLQFTDTLIRSVCADNVIAELREQQKELVNQKFKNSITLIKLDMLRTCCVNMHCSYFNRNNYAKTDEWHFMKICQHQKYWVSVIQGLLLVPLKHLNRHDRSNFRNDIKFLLTIQVLVNEGTLE